MIETNDESSAERHVLQLKLDMSIAMSRLRLDEAESIYRELIDQCGVDPDSDDMLPSRVMLGVFDGRVRDMLQMLNGLGEDRALGLKATCLQLLGDPLWEGMALQVLESDASQQTRDAMRILLEPDDD